MFPMLCFPTVLESAVCGSNPCLNGGKCTGKYVYDDEYKLTLTGWCDCYIGYSGNNCEGW